MSPATTATATPPTALAVQLRAARARLAAGTLTDADLAAIEAQAGPMRQDLLFLQASSTHPGSGALGMALVIDGVMQEPPWDGAWPYQNVLEALQDGWRVISFPNLALLTTSPGAKGLGCEFILERWRPA